ncbi:MAG TPA: Mov34/MPN/PAD-1 family protein [Candidatus Micrarchaeia archaeon]|nr:Mov34/MPN/PAD-1 family protein [Candidatus Micrarchaeia archaeon]
MTLWIRPRILVDTFDCLRACGRGVEECVVYWTARQSSLVVDDLVHPTHSAGPAGYEVDSRWVTQFFLDLRHAKRTALAQVHTHPGTAFHSQTDDTYALVSSQGFYSLVIPDGGMGLGSLSGAYFTVVAASGHWKEVDPSTELVWSGDD